MSTIARIRVREYDRMIRRGVFNGPETRRIELVRGELREMTPIGNPHAEIVDRLLRWSFANVPGDRIRVRSQNPLGLVPQRSVLQPDVTWLVEADYMHRRPAAQDVLLAIEVSESSLRYDRETKGSLYATAEIPEYWIVNVEDQSIEVYQQPLNGRHTSLKTYRGDEQVSPLALPNCSLVVRDLFEG